MSLWEFLRQWPGRRIVIGITVSVLLHALLVVAGLWGLVPGLAPQWKTKPGDSLIVELPRPDEPAGAGAPSPAPPAPSPAPRTPAPPAPAPAAPPAARVPPRPAPAPAREKAAPPREEPRVASAPRPSPPTPPVPRAPETPSSVPEPTPRAPEPAPRAPEPAPRVAEPTPRDEPAPPAGEPARPAEAAPRGSTPVEPRRESGERQVASVPPSGSGRPSLSDVRAALRSGSGGLAGQDRGGIEGDPIPLDSADGRYSDYLDQVKRQIQEKWSMPCVRPGPGQPCEQHETSLDVQFGILKNGRVQYVDVVRVSVHSEYDDYAVRAILLAQPYPPVPPVMMRAMKAGSTGLSLRARFVYIQPSFVKFLR